ncbi:tetratricopeptide repeat protein [Ruminococcus sp.]|uniref:tetratricopeptide repeat protein n=1 Tax=Ruminococcus sp. TaxID=41978 RepID=UPI00388E659E
MRKTDEEAVALFVRADVLYQSGKQEESLPLFRQAAELGHPEAISTLGGFYMNGQLVEKDVQKGVMLLENAAQLNDQIGMTWMAGVFIDGNEVLPRSPEKAAYWTGRYLMEYGDLITAKELLDRIVSTDESAKAYFQSMLKRGAYVDPALPDDT